MGGATEGGGLRDGGDVREEEGNGVVLAGKNQKVHGNGRVKRAYSKYQRRARRARRTKDQGKGALGSSADETEVGSVVWQMTACDWPTSMEKDENEWEE
ncbi:uncharacterized protein SPSK_10671 [Sporothrix schenckii 1099-18]|uniref:Uncharacterized protein n=1 Tax=Sporothrix schenckii 1099-18 TaxID=1397361 RepID=A0A0F2LWN9_SPOSC|nr:uncharacterized protein SPSK_10671 [Sporothrix schenckii 1099-18]KJR80910.1 hypothetical protein SPSK_10671 [Sporothrix schenckii 1099-18]